MNLTKSYSGILLIFIAIAGWNTLPDNWLSEKYKSYTIFYKKPDEGNRKEYLQFIDNGIKSVNLFFSDSFKEKFDIYVHLNRQSLDSQWQKIGKCRSSNPNAGWLPVGWAIN